MTDGLVVPTAELARGIGGRRHTKASLVAAFLAGRNAPTVCAYRQDLGPSASSCGCPPWTRRRRPS